MPRSIPVHDIAIQERDNEIVVGTHGRSIYLSSLDSVQLLLKNPEYRQKKQSEATRLVAVLRGNQMTFLKEGVDIDCPPVKKGKVKNKFVKIQ